MKAISIILLTFSLSLSIAIIGQTRCERNSDCPSGICNASTRTCR